MPRHDMPLPKQSDWRFDDIREQDATRAAYLENAPKFEAIVSSIMTALTNSLTRKQFFFGVDHYKDMRNQRVIFQFNVTPQLYDTFFSARTGYRAHYWAFPERGQQANAKLIQTLWTAMSSTLPDRSRSSCNRSQRRRFPTRRFGHRSHSHTPFTGAGIVHSHRREDLDLRKTDAWCSRTFKGYPGGSRRSAAIGCRMESTCASAGQRINVFGLKRWVCQR